MKNRIILGFLAVSVLVSAWSMALPPRETKGSTLFVDELVFICNLPNGQIDHGVTCQSCWYCNCNWYTCDDEWVPGT